MTRRTRPRRAPRAPLRYQFDARIEGLGEVAPEALRALFVALAAFAVAYAARAAAG